MCIILNRPVSREKMLNLEPRKKFTYPLSNHIYFYFSLKKCFLFLILLMEQFAMPHSVASSLFK